MPYLDGKKVDHSAIVPGKCIFTGYFRPVDWHGSTCPMCGRYFVGESPEEAHLLFNLCLKEGHLDEPVYTSIGVGVDRKSDVAKVESILREGEICTA